jgi:hypothetical protein
LKDVQWNSKTTEPQVQKSVSADDMFIIQKNIETNFSMIALLTRSNELGIVYGLKGNYRLASIENLQNCNGLSKSMEQHAFSDKNEQEFNSTPLGVMFYRMVRTRHWGRNSQRLVSICKEDLLLQRGKTVKSSEIEIAQSSAAYVTESEFKKLAFIMNTNVSDKANGLSDFEAILTCNSDEPPRPGMTIEDLTKFVNETLEWKFFSIKKDKSLSYNFMRVRSFLQVMTGVGLAILEGSHRVTLACKLLTGTDLNTAFPVELKDLKLNQELPKNSPLHQNVTVQVLTPAKDDDNKKVNHPYVPTVIVKACQKWSQKVAEAKTHLISSSWKEWIDNTMRSLADKFPKRDPFCLDDFIRIKLRVRNETDDYIVVLNTIVKNVCKSLFQCMPAKKLADKAMQYCGRMKDNKRKMSPELFLRHATKGKFMMYSGGFFLSVRTQTHA